MNRGTRLTRLIYILIALAAVVHFGSEHAAAQAPLFTISGTVTNSNGQPLADVAVVLLSDAVGTQVALTNQSGDYALTYTGGVSHNIRITPSKAGFIFNPLAVAIISSSPLNGDRNISFVGAQLPFPLPSLQMPFLLTQENSPRALALDSVTLTSEPFGVNALNNFSTDQRTRISLFAVNIELGAGETASIIEAQAEDSLGSVVPLPVEFFGTVPNVSWLKQVVVKLPDQIANSNEVSVSLKVRGTVGNKVTVKVKP